MDATPAERRRELVERLFPELRQGGDPDLGRYFELRREGQLGRALAVYNGPLRARYPDDASRALLLRLYREGDERWLLLQARLLEELGARLEGRARRAVDLLVAPIEGLRAGDPYRALAAAESLVRAASGGGEGAGAAETALAAVERYAKLAALLGHRAAQAARAEEVVREYLAMLRQEAAGEYDFVARSAALEARRREASRSPRGAAGAAAKGGPATPDFVAASREREVRRRAGEARRGGFFDLERIRFSEADRARIEIDRRIERREDKVLAYCAKYWRRAADPAFERMVFLYSRKFGTRHHEILLAIRIGRARKRTDDEILTAVSGIVSERYAYSVAGDMYLQASWRRIRAGLDAEEAAAAQAREEAAKAAAPSAGAARPAARPEARRGAALPEAAPGERASAKATARPQAAARPSAERPAAERPAKTDSRGAKAAAPPAEPVAAGPGPTKAPRGSEAAPPRNETAPLRPETASRNAPPRKARRPEPRSAPRAAERLPAEAKASAPADRASERGAPALRALPARGGRTGARGLAAPRAAADPLPAVGTAGGSVSDRIKKLAGTGYDVYRENFLGKVRVDLRRSLARARTKPARIFDPSLNEAEDLVFGFLAAHYDDPYMDWEGSSERRSLEGLGFALPSLDPVIEACFRRL